MNRRVAAALVIVAFIALALFVAAYVAGDWLGISPPTPDDEYALMCTPPVCAIGTSEVYYCPGDCPGGCGTTCATFTPEP
jgi:hypothetical protein